ncbi:MAG TPA: hypothetical protein VEW42_02195 [Candidatus Eisenbacteria bacterium]|nr:hypothetical protein [Candidatus Eisenbacteria bacterium]
MGLYERSRSPQQKLEGARTQQRQLINAIGKWEETHQDQPPSIRQRRRQRLLEGLEQRHAELLSEEQTS